MQMRYVSSAILIALFLAPFIARAQARPDPANPAIKSPAPLYGSPFADYQRYTDDKPLAWREANDHVMKLGGHAGHIKDGGPARDRSSAPTGSAPPPMPSHEAAPAGGHTRHKH